MKESNDRLSATAKVLVMGGSDGPRQFTYDELVIIRAKVTPRTTEECNSKGLSELSAKINGILNPATKTIPMWSDAPDRRSARTQREDAKRAAKAERDAAFP